MITCPICEYNAVNDDEFLLICPACKHVFYVDDDGTLSAAKAGPEERRLLRETLKKNMELKRKLAAAEKVVEAAREIKRDAHLLIQNECMVKKDILDTMIEALAAYDGREGGDEPS